jgi:hypothetical protein
LARQADVHFLMTTGYITQGQSALYLAETTTGQFGVYTMGPGPNGAGIVIRRHDLTRFREAAAFGGGGPPPGGGGILPQAQGGGGGVIPPAIPPAAGGAGGTIPPTLPPATGGGMPVIPPPAIGGQPASFPPPGSLPTIPRSGLPGTGEISPNGGKVNPGNVPPDANPFPSPPSGGISPPAGEPRPSGRTNLSHPSRVSAALTTNDRSHASEPPPTTSANTWPSSEPRSATTGDSHKVPLGTQQLPPSTTSARLPQLSPLPPLRNDAVAANFPSSHPKAEYPPNLRMGYPPYSGMYATPPFAPPPIDPTVLLQHFLRPLSVP